MLSPIRAWVANVEWRDVTLAIHRNRDFAAGLDQRARFLDAVVVARYRIVPSEFAMQRVSWVACLLDDQLRSELAVPLEH